MEIYCALGCSKQNLSYWKNHSFSTQHRKSLYKVIRNAGTFFEMLPEETEALANKAGLSLCEHENALSDIWANNIGLLKPLYENALISERMFRYYKTKEPTKQALLAIAISLGMSFDESDALLRKYGYCLSRSLAADMVVRWYLTANPSALKSATLLDTVNQTLYDMGLPLLMTRQNLNES